MTKGSEHALGPVSSGDACACTHFSVGERCLIVGKTGKVDRRRRERLGSYWNFILQAQGNPLKNFKLESNIVIAMLLRLRKNGFWFLFSFLQLTSCLQWCFLLPSQVQKTTGESRFVLSEGEREVRNKQVIFFFTDFCLRYCFLLGKDKFIL